MKHIVSFQKCPEYSSASVQAAVDAAVSDCGGWPAFVKPGQKILLKVNMLSDHKPEDAVTTHPEVVRAVIRSVKSAGGIPLVGDSPASAVSIRKIWASTGIEAVCGEENAELLVFENGEPRSVSRDGFSFSLSAALAKADAVINLPKVKTHALTTLTCGVKNLYGCIPGYQKAILHKENPSVSVFARLLRAILEEMRPALTIADGIVGMEGEGPASGKPVNLGFVAAAGDPVALDLEICATLGIPPKSVPYLRADAASGAYAEIARLGPSADELRPAKFKVPGTAKFLLIPNWLTRPVKSLVWIRPAIDYGKCVSCGRCAKLCPPHALEFSKKSPEDVKPFPRLAHPKSCIGCCCCHEMCIAKAITMKQSPLLRIYGAFRDL